MLKMTYEATSLAVSKKELADAVKSFLLHSDSHRDLILVENIDSQEFGASDLLFRNRAGTNLTVAQLSDGESSEKFFVSSMCYYFWLIECIAAGRVFFNGKIGLDLYLFCQEYPSGVCYLLNHLSQKNPIHMVTYNIIHVEDLDEPAIHFQCIDFKYPIQEDSEKNRLGSRALFSQETGSSTPLEISAEEIRDFHRLKQHYLD